MVNQFTKLRWVGQSDSTDCVSGDGYRKTVIVHQVTGSQPSDLAEAWGESVDATRRTEVSSGAWRFGLTATGIVGIEFAGRVVSPRIAFTVRDELWASPALPMVFDDEDLGRFRADVEGWPLRLEGTVRAEGARLEVDFRITAAAEVRATRIGPVMLHERDALEPSFGYVSDAGTREIALPEAVSVERVASGFTGLDFETGGIRVQVEFEGDVFEMEDQRNWGEVTLKSYSPPLGGPELIMAAGETRHYSVRITATERASAVATEAIAHDAHRHPMPRLGLAHRGGRLPEVAVERLNSLALSYLHLLVDLADPAWRDSLLADLGAAAQLGVDAVLSVDADPADDALLRDLAALSAGRVSMAYVFDRGLPGTSVELAAAAFGAFAGSRIRVGGGSRAHFATLSLAGGVPRQLEDVAVAVAVAVHGDERDALVRSFETLPAITDATRALVGDRPLLVGPLGFATTFDSWGPLGTPHDLDGDWTRAHPRDGTEFAAAWLVGSIALLASADVERITVGATFGGRGCLDLVDGHLVERPTYAALKALAPMAGSLVTVARPEPGVVELTADGALIRASLRDRPTVTTGQPEAHGAPTG